MPKSNDQPPSRAPSEAPPDTYIPEAAVPTDAHALTGARETLKQAIRVAEEALGAQSDDVQLIQKADDATGRACDQISAKASLQVAVLRSKDGVTHPSILGVVRQGAGGEGMALFVPNDPTLAAFLLPDELAHDVDDGRVVRLSRDPELSLVDPSHTATTEVELESAPAGQLRRRFIGPVVVVDGTTFVNDPYHAGTTVNAPLADEDVAAAGTVVEVRVHADGRAHLIGAPLAAAGSARAQMYGIAARHNLDPTFPARVMEEVSTLQQNDGIQSGLDSGELQDLRHLAFVTIDNDDSRDLDQAMFIEKRDGGAHDVFYALADASFYVRPGTALFAESLKRAASFYLPGLAVPMLPEALSEDLVSLNEDKDRRSLVMKLSIDRDGKATDTAFIRAIVRSRAKLAYNSVQRFHDLVKEGKGESDSRHFGHDFTDTLMRLKDVGEIRMREAASRDVVSFHRTPVKVVAHPPMARASEMGGEGRTFSVIADERNDVEKWNEQISLLCNIQGARFLLDEIEKSPANSDLQAIFRVHDAPPRARVKNLHRFIRSLVRARSLDASVWMWNRGRESLASYLGRLPTTGEQMRTTRAIHQQAMVINVRSEFRADPGGHHGVGSEDGYARFSSPMRELVGVFVHKETFEVLLDNPRGRVPEQDAAIRERVIEVSNAAKQIQSRITKEANKLAIDELFSPDLDLPLEHRRVFSATLMGVSSGKIYVQLDDPPIDVKLYLNALAPHVGGDVRVANDGVSVEGAWNAAAGEGISVRVASYDDKRSRYNLVPVLD